MYSSDTPSTSRGGSSAKSRREVIKDARRAGVGESESALLRILVKASARFRCAAEISCGTGTACGRVRDEVDGVIWLRVEKKVLRSGRRGGGAFGDLGRSVACSPVTKDSG